MVTYGVKDVLKIVRTSARTVRNTIPTVVATYMTEARTGVTTVSIRLTTVTNVMNTMQTDAIDVTSQRIPIIMAIVLSMTIRTDLMLSSIAPTKRSDYSLG